MTDVPAFAPDPAAYLYEEVADHIALRITMGDLVAGQRLPSERELTDEYGVALGTIRKATALLRERGLVHTLAAKGTFVRSLNE